MDKMLDRAGKVVDMALRYLLEPAMNWVIDHPIISVAVVAGLVYWSVRGYRTL